MKTAKYSILLVILAACAVIIFPGRLSAQKNDNFFVIKGEISGAFEQAPEEVQLVMQALIAALRGEFRADQFGPVLFEENSLLQVRKAEGTFYRGFDVDSIQISYINQQPDGTFQFIGRIIWQDKILRRAATSFSLIFKTAPNFIRIKNAVVARMPPNMPRVMVFLVLEKNVKKQLKVARKGYLPLLELVSENAVHLDQPSSFPRGKQRYLLFTFSLDRLAGEERIDYIIGDGDPENDIRPKQQKLINYSGWPVLVLASTFDLKEKEPPLYRIFYTPSQNHPRLLKPQQVAAFTLTGKK